MQAVANHSHRSPVGTLGRQAVRSGGGKGTGCLQEEGTGLFEWFQSRPKVGTVLGKLAWQEAGR